MGSYPQIPASERVKRYQTLAEDARQLADEATEERAQSSFRAIAERWEKLAEAAGGGTTVPDD